MPVNYEKVIESLLRLIDMQDKQIKTIGALLKLDNLMGDKQQNEALKRLLGKRSLFTAKKGAVTEQMERLADFLDVFKRISGREHKDVEKDLLIAELIHDKKFTREEAEEFILTGIASGKIRQTKDGYYNFDFMVRD